MISEPTLASELAKRGFTLCSQRDHRARWLAQLAAGKRPASLLAQGLEVGGSRKDALLDAAAGVAWATDTLLRGDSRYVDQGWARRHKEQIKSWLRESMAGPMSANPLARVALAKPMKDLFESIDLEQIVAEVRPPEHYRDTVVGPFFTDLRARIESEDADADRPFAVPWVLAQVEYQRRLARAAFNLLVEKQFSEFAIRRFTDRLEDVFGEGSGLAKRKALGKQLAAWLLRTQSELTVELAGAFATWVGGEADVQGYKYASTDGREYQKGLRSHEQSAPALVAEVEHAMYDLLVPPPGPERRAQV
jgi:hypothetical protein